MAQYGISQKEGPICFHNTINTAKNIQIINNQVHKIYTKNILRPEFPAFPEKMRVIVLRMRRSSNSYSLYG